MAKLQGFDFEIDDGQTPLDPDEAQGLKLKWVATRADLNDVEGANVVSGMLWAARAIRKKDVVVPSDATPEVAGSNALARLMAFGASRPTA